MLFSVTIGLVFLLLCSCIDTVVTTTTNLSPSYDVKGFIQLRSLDTLWYRVTEKDTLYRKEGTKIVFVSQDTTSYEVRVFLPAAYGQTKDIYNIFGQELIGGYSLPLVFADSTSVYINNKPLLNSNLKVGDEVIDTIDNSDGSGKVEATTVFTGVELYAEDYDTSYFYKYERSFKSFYHIPDATFKKTIRVERGNAIVSVVTLIETPVQPNNEFYRMKGTAVLTKRGRYAVR